MAAYRAGRGRLPEPHLSRLAEAPVREAPVTIDVAMASRSMRLDNQDPADRFIAASAMVFGLTLITADGDRCDCPDIEVLANTR